MQELQDRFFAMPIGHAPLEFGPVVLESISQLEKNLLICGHRSFVFSVNEILKWCSTQLQQNKVLGSQKNKEITMGELYR
jgi:hypothetical protein